MIMAVAISTSFIGCVSTPDLQKQCEPPPPPSNVDLSKIHVFAGDSDNRGFTRKVKDKKYIIRCDNSDINNYVAISYEDFLTLNTMVKYCTEVDLE